MPLTLQQLESHWLIRLEGAVNIQCAPELKKVLIEWQGARVPLELDLERAEELDITILQLLWAARHEAADRIVRIASRPSAAAARALADFGFSADAGEQA